MSAQGDKISSLDLLDNVIPETDSIAEDVKQLLGLSISTQTVRVPMSSGILQYVSVGFNNTPTKDEIIGCWEAYQGGAVSHKLPSAPDKLLHYFEGERQPQPKLCQDVDRGRGVSIGALTHGGPYDYQFAIASNPTIRGPLGGAILNAELLVRLGFVFW
jgi:aspartate-semialdehyde dehydrogenase